MQIIRTRMKVDFHETVAIRNLLDCTLFSEFIFIWRNRKQKTSRQTSLWGVQEHNWRTILVCVRVKSSLALSSGGCDNFISFNGIIVGIRDNIFLCSELGYYLAYETTKNQNRTTPFAYLKQLLSQSTTKETLQKVAQVDIKLG